MSKLPKPTGWWALTATVLLSFAASAVYSGHPYQAGALVAAALGCVLLALRAWGHDEENGPLPYLTFASGSIHDRQSGEFAYVHNIGGSAATDVTIANMTVGMVEFAFDHIPAIPAGDKKPLTIIKATGVPASDGSRLDVAQVWGPLSKGREHWFALAAKDSGPMTIPVTITFRDFLRRKRIERQALDISRDGHIKVHRKTPVSLDKPKA